MATAAQMENGQSDGCKNCGGNYILIKDEEDPRLTMFNMPLPCCGCGIGWCSLLLGFVCPLIWYFAAVLYLCRYYNKDPRERSGLAANAIALDSSTSNGIEVYRPHLVQESKAFRTRWGWEGR